MSKPTFAERCQIAEQCLPDTTFYRAMLTKLHAEMLRALAEQPSQQNGQWCMKMNGCKTKCEDCPDEVAEQPAQQAIYTSDSTAQLVERQGDIAEVTTGPGYAWPGETTCRVMNTGNGYIAYFPAPNCTTQDYYVCLDYAQARDLVLGLSMFKKELGFEE